MISLLNICKKYDRQEVLSDISFDVKGGEIFGLLGPNGAGKTTLMNIISKREKATSGTLLVDTDLISFCPQTIALYPNLTVYENINFFIRVYSLSSNRGKEVLDIFNIQDYANKKVQTLSEGLKRKVNLAVSILAPWKILILDEPTAGVDTQSRTEIISVIKNMRDSDRIVIYISHYLDELEKVCDRLAIINKGKILTVGKNEEILSEYSNRTYIRWIENNCEKKATLLNNQVKSYLVEILKRNIHDLSVKRENLEDIYLRLVGL